MYSPLTKSLYLRIVRNILLRSKHKHPNFILFNPLICDEENGTISKMLSQNYNFLDVLSILDYIKNLHTAKDIENYLILTT